jgi:hypothetical protein
MGVYSTVVAELECERCHSTYRTDAQVYTDDDREMPEYIAGQLVPAPKPGTTYEGIADAFCSNCMREWVEDEKVANFEELAKAIKAGEIAARLATYRLDPDRPELGRQLNVRRQDPLTPTEAIGLAHAAGRPGWRNFPARLSEASVTLFRGQTPLDDILDDPWSAAHGDRVRERLSAKGWRAPSNGQFRDVTVRVDSDGRILVGSS